MVGLVLGLTLPGGLWAGGPSGPARGAERAGTATSAYAQWKHGPGAGADYFPIAVWGQDPKNAARFEAAGFNLYVGLWKGPTEEQLGALTRARMPVICSQNEVGLAHKEDPIIVGWMRGDEPDNARSLGEGKGYGPPIAPEKVIRDYAAIQQADPSRPVLLNLGPGVANDAWHGRGPGAKQSDYLDYVKGGDIISFDIYPAASTAPDVAGKLWLVALGVDRLKTWSEGKRILWNCIECTHIQAADHKATPQEVRAEVWMSIVHGSRGLIYFVHQFQPRFIEAGLLADEEMLQAVTAINKELQALAPVLNSADLTGAVEAFPADPEVPVDVLAKQHEGATYLFAVAMRPGATTVRFTLRSGPEAGRATVVGEGRELPVAGGRFEDHFDPYQVHIYRITQAERAKPDVSR
jgi:Zn ribbon nucleic-acid-binding protein